MWKVGFCLLLLVVCLELSEARRGGRFKLKRWKKFSHKGKFHGAHRNTGKEAKYMKKGKMSNPEMMMMMRMKKMLSPLRDLFTKVLDLGPQKSFEGRPEFCGKNQCPHFEDLKEEKHYELRKYNSSTWVSTSVIAKEWTSEVQRSLFWPLFGYIQGANKEKKTIDMTVPVITLVRPDSSAEGTNFTMAFYMPSTLDKVPTPTNEKIKVISKDGFKAYVHSFKGYAYGQEVWEKHAIMLEKHLNKDGLKGKYYEHEKMFITAGYDDPMKMFNRHNEIWLKAKA